MTTTFRILCGSQFVIALLIFVFGLVDRLKVKLLYSFLMLPIWIGILAVIAGAFGIWIGNSYQRWGFLGPNMVSGLRAINIVCVAVAYYAFSCYGNTLVALFLDRETYFASVSSIKESSVDKAITSVLMILFIAEMFCGVWLALLNKEVMFLGFTPPIQQLPMAMNYGAPQDHRQTTPPTINFCTQQEYQQQQPQQHVQQFPGQ